MRKSIVFSATGAVVLVAAAAVLRFAILPGLQQLPGDLDTTLHYSGTGDVVNTAAIQSGDLASAFVKGAPVTVDERIKTVTTSGSTAVLSDEITAKAAGNPLLSTKHTWAVNRKTLEPASAPSGTTADAHEGLAVGFPLSPKAQDYKYWDTITQTAAPAAYQKTEKHNGRNTYVYTAHATGPVKDPGVLAVVPAALPKTTLISLAATLAPALQASLGQAAALLPDQVPLSYTATNDTTYWVDTKTGFVVDMNQKQVISAGLSLGGTTAPLADVFALDVKFTPDTVKSVTNDAKSADRGLFLLGTLGPIVLLVLGLLLLVVAVWPRRRDNSRQTPAGPPAASPSPVTADAPSGD